MKISNKVGVFIVGGKRTPIGKYLGIYTETPPTYIGAYLLRSIFHHLNINTLALEEFILGAANTASMGQNPAAQIVTGGNFKTNTNSYSIHTGCTSGIQAIIQGIKEIQLRHSNILAAGGLEVFSNIPFYFPQRDYLKNRKDFPNEEMGCLNLEDGINDTIFGLKNWRRVLEILESTLSKLNITRELQDEYAFQSFNKLDQSNERGDFMHDIIPIQIPTKSQDPFQQFKEIYEDEYLFSKLSTTELKKEKCFLQEQFQNPTITFLNSMKKTDGACFICMMSEDQISKETIEPKARIVEFSTISYDEKSEDLIFGDSIAIQECLKKANLKIDDIDVFEINESFSGLVLANQKRLQIPDKKMNINGGALFMGNPSGMSGSRIVLNLTSLLVKNNWKYGIASISNLEGLLYEVKVLGNAAAILIENCSFH